MAVKRNQSVAHRRQGDTPCPSSPSSSSRTRAESARSTSTRACCASASSSSARRSTTRPRTSSSPSSCTWRPRIPTRTSRCTSTRPGGIVYSGLAIYDTMRFIKPDVATTCCGIAMSMGSLLLTGGAEGKRSALPNSRILAPPAARRLPGPGVATSRSTPRRRVKLRRRMEEIYAEHTGRTREEVSDVLERDRYFTPEEAREFGLIDRVVNGRGSTATPRRLRRATRRPAPRRGC